MNRLEKLHCRCSKPNSGRKPASVSENIDKMLVGLPRVHGNINANNCSRVDPFGGAMKADDLHGPRVIFGERGFIYL